MHLFPFEAIQRQISTTKKAMVHEFDVVEEKVKFDPELFKSWFPGMVVQ